MGELCLLRTSKHSKQLGGKMPRKKAPNSLRAISLKYICDNFELICYGVTWRHPGWRDFLTGGHYLTVLSPLTHLPVHVLTELAEAVLDHLGSAPHILQAVKLLVERTTSLASLELSSCRSVNPLVVA